MSESLAAADVQNVSQESVSEALGELFSKSGSAMMLANNDRYYVDVNDAACQMLSAERSDIVGKRIEDFSAPEIRDQVPALYEAFLKVKSLSGAFTMIDAKGREVHCMYSASADVVPGLHLSILVPTEEAEPELDVAEETEAVANTLTEREREVLALLALGGTNASIARRLHLSPETVRSHTRSARLRLGAKSRSHAIALALQSGQLDLDI